MNRQTLLTCLNDVKEILVQSDLGILEFSELNFECHELLTQSSYIIFFIEYGVKLAKDDLFANILPNMLELTDYEEQYMTPEERKNRGFQVK